MMFGAFIIGAIAALIVAIFLTVAFAAGFLIIKFINKRLKNKEEL